jgi:hypothetical protein
MSNIDKAEIKKLTAINIGAGIEDMQEQARTAEKMHQGGHLILKEAVSKIAALTEVLRSEFIEGTIKASDIEAPEKVEALVRKYIARAQNIVDNMRMGEVNAQIAAAAAAQAYGRAMTVVTKVVTEEQGKIEALTAPSQEADVEDAGRPPARPVGQHPGDPLADRRTAAKSSDEGILGGKGGSVPPAAGGKALKPPKKGPARG